MTVTSLILGLDVSPRRLGERFASKVRLGERGCWLWTGASTKGYGQFKINGVQRAAHRVAYEWTFGPIPEGLVIDHLCRVTRCVNPEHMEAVTNAENIRRGNVGLRESSKTHCPKGHPYSGDNLYVYSRGRGCRTCRAARLRAAYQARKAAA